MCSLILIIVFVCFSVLDLYVNNIPLLAIVFFLQNGFTALHHAASNRKLEAVRVLIKEFGVDPNTPDNVCLFVCHCMVN